MTLSQADLDLFADGRHHRLWTVLGAHPETGPDGRDGRCAGTRFAVWAPHARAVRVIGDFNSWTNRTPMSRRGASGVWETFVPDVAAGALYKYRIVGSDGHTGDRADPMAQQTELPPATASVVTSSSHRWTDQAWLAARSGTDPRAEPMTVYEVHPGSWRPGLDYRQLARELGEYVRDLGFTHIELLPITEHPYGGSWGYQVTSYYAPTARFGTPDDFRAFVDHLHGLGIGVIMDWVPGHFPKDDWALARFDGGPLYEPADPLAADQPDWGTYIFDYATPQVANFLIASALFWIDQFHIDGIRVDAVASMLYLDYSRAAGRWTPNVYGGRENLAAASFLQRLNDAVRQRHPGTVMIAEEPTSWPGVTRSTNLGGLGFGMKWNMGWMHDTLHYLGHDPVHRSFHHHEITYSLQYAWSEQFVLPISHDEVVHGKGTLWTRMPGDAPTKAAGVRLLLAGQWAHPGKQLLFMGQEFGQPGEWADDRSLDWSILHGPNAELHSGIRALVRDLNRLARCPALHRRDGSPDGFAWIDANDTQGNVLCFLRCGQSPSTAGETIAVVINYSGTTHHDYRVGLPIRGRWREILNTDAREYGGGGAGNHGELLAAAEPWHGRPASVSMTLPANSTIWLAPLPESLV